MVSRLFGVGGVGQERAKDEREPELQVHLVREQQVCEHQGIDADDGPEQPLEELQEDPKEEVFS